MGCSTSRPASKRSPKIAARAPPSRQAGCSDPTGLSFVVTVAVVLATFGWAPRLRHDEIRDVRRRKARSSAGLCLGRLRAAENIVEDQCQARACLGELLRRPHRVSLISTAQLVPPDQAVPFAPAARIGGWLPALPERDRAVPRSSAGCLNPVLPSGGAGRPGRPRDTHPSTHDFAAMFDQDG